MTLVSGRRRLCIDGWWVGEEIRNERPVVQLNPPRRSLQLRDFSDGGQVTNLDSAFRLSTNGDLLILDLGGFLCLNKAIPAGDWLVTQIAAR